MAINFYRLKALPNYVSDKNVDVNEFYNDYMNLYPTSFLRKKIKKTFDKIGKDKLHGNRSAVTCVVWLC